jgi:very-short-patch-repair endonuclease
LGEGWGEGKEVIIMRNLTHLARRLRQESTEAERLLWKHLRGRKILNLKFRRQEQISDYIVDFVCYERKFIIELDGGHHNQDETREKDIKRQNWLIDEGFTVIRFWNSEVLKNINGVLQTIKEKLIPSP